MEFHRRKLSVINQRIEFDSVETFDHWSNFVFLLFFIGCMGFVFITESSGIDLIVTILILLLIVGLFLRHKIMCRNLKMFKTELTKTQFKEANEAAAKLNDWIVVHSRKDYFEAIKPAGWQWEGFRITSILDKNRIFINSMVSPAIKSNPFSFGLNKKNEIELRTQYSNVLNGENVVENTEQELIKRELEFWNESELSTKNFLMKLIAYPIGIALAILAIYLISTLEIQGIFHGVIVLGFVGSYFYYDIKVIIEKCKRKNSQAITIDKK
jgi:hypothetical protein